MSLIIGDVYFVCVSCMKNVSVVKGCVCVRRGLSRDRRTVMHTTRAPGLIDVQIYAQTRVREGGMRTHKGNSAIQNVKNYPHTTTAAAAWLEPAVWRVLTYV